MIAKSAGQSSCSFFRRLNCQLPRSHRTLLLILPKFLQNIHSLLLCHAKFLGACDNVHLLLTKFLSPDSTLSLVEALPHSVPNCQCHLLVHGDSFLKYVPQFLKMQFVLILVHVAVGRYNQCDFPPILEYAVMVYCVVLIAFFGNFYVQAYIRKSRRKHLD